MVKALGSVAALFLGVAILLTGQGLQGTLVPLRAGLEHFPAISVGLIGAGYFLGFTLGCLNSANLLRRVGHARVFAAMTATASAVPLLHGMFADPWVWGLLRMITGFCFAVLYVVIESWINEVATNENRGVIFSSYVVITLTVMAAGQMMLLLFDPLELMVFAVASVLVSLAAIPVALTTAPTPSVPTSSSMKLKQLFQNSPAATFGCLVSGLANGSFWALAPLFTQGVSSDESLASWFMTGAVIGGALAQWPLGYLSDKLGRRKVLAASTTGGAIAGLLLVTFGTELGTLQLSLLGGAWGAMAFPLYSVSVAHANDRAEPDEFVAISSGLLFMYGMGAIAGPLLASTLMTFSGPAGLYVFASGTHLALLAYVLLRTIRRKPVASGHHMAFSDALAATYTASQVYEEEYAEAPAGEALSDVEPAQESKSL